MGEPDNFGDVSSPREIQRLNQVFAHVIAGLSDLHLGGVRVEINFHLHRSSRDRLHVGAHSHPWWDISMLRNGLLEYLADGRKVFPGKNEVVLIPAGVEHAWTAKRNPLVMESYMLGLFAQTATGEDVLASIRQRVGEAGFCFSLGPRLRRCREDLWTAIMEKPPGPLHHQRIAQLMQLFVVQMFAELFGREFADEDAKFRAEIGQSGGNAKLIARMEEYLRNHLADRITMRDLERQFGYSHRHLSRLFKEHTGSSIQRYLLTKRILAACDLLINTDARTKEAAHAVGLADASYFCRLFREYTKFTPRQYREAHRK